MALSAIDLYSIGIGPSSSHTVGPMRAANAFARSVVAEYPREVTRVRVTMYGSLGATGIGHGTPDAVLLGLEGHEPASVDVEAGREHVRRIRGQRRVRLGGRLSVEMDPSVDLVLDGATSLPAHPNGMTFEALGRHDRVLRAGTYYSIGGGFVVTPDRSGALPSVEEEADVPYPFANGDELVAQCERTDLSVSELVLCNELTWRSETEVRRRLLEVSDAMRECIDRGLSREGILPGGLRVVRRAPALHDRLRARAAAGEPADRIDWLSLYALAVNEENAAGGRVVTAPTNGAAGIMPAVLHTHLQFEVGASPEDAVRFLLAGAAVGMIVKRNASISGAEMGCQGEVGSACAMAAAGLCEVMGGSPRQVENAAEMGIEHNLGLTCDPVGGLVQIPCIERNAIASAKAVSAAQLARHGDGSHVVSLDQAVLTMRQTGKDMMAKYKETSLGGLAVNVVEC